MKKKKVQAPNIPDVLSCLLAHDESTNRWTGHCLDFDIVTSGKSVDSAWENLRAALTLHVEHCFTHHHRGLNHKAPQRDWDLFCALKKQQHFIRTEPITLRLILPQVVEMPPLWVQGVESTTGSAVCGKTSTASVQAVH
jgi:predicted RNase H-like HicB family nuclease